MSKAIEIKTGDHVRRFKSYPAHKDSGVEWLGKVPEHWEVKRVRTILRDNDGIKIGPFGSALKSEIIREKGYKVYGQEQVINGDFQIGEKYVDENKFSELNTCEIIPGDLVVSMMGTTGKCQVVPDNIERGIMDSHLLRIRPKATIHPQLLARLINESDYIRFQVSTNSKGSIMEGLNSSIIKNLSLLLPSLNEQRIIAAFLDRETARIDQLIAKKERQIELLQEKRSALIGHAVTKGLNPKAKMKNSGIEWLGEMPEHWEVLRFKYLLTEPLKYGANEVAELDDPNLPRYVRITDVNEDGSLRDDTFKSLPEEIAKPYFLREGDLLFARSGATVGKTFYYQEAWGRAAYAGYLIRARIAPNKMLSKFGAYFARSTNYWNWLRSSMIQATIQNVSAEKYAGLVLGIPPIDEQMRIVAYIDKDTEQIDALSIKLTDSIAKLREYRTALISAAVTGKIDVRKEAVS